MPHLCIFLVCQLTNETSGGAMQSMHHVNDIYHGTVSNTVSLPVKGNVSYEKWSISNPFKLMFLLFINKIISKEYCFLDSVRFSPPIDNMFLIIYQIVKRLNHNNFNNDYSFSYNIFNLTEPKQRFL